ncbi:MAG: polyprenol monophosphomannose synthase [bacterium]|nr:polyprenol monophosphomannose synthase [bacterium]
MKIVVIIPTYRERENIQKLIPLLAEQRNRINHDLQILVVDDNSPDGTAQAVGELIKTHKNLHLVSGEKQGLGAAYIRGMRYAMEKLEAEIVVEMDADLSHKPEDLPRLIAEIDSGADFVIGSRYVPGGKIPEGWSLLRKANSRWGNRFARYIAGIDDVADCTAGFRAIRVELLKKIDLTKLHVKGYSFQMSLLFEAFVGGGKIKEVPVEFVERKIGHTKIGPGDIIEFVWTAFKLRDRRLKLKGLGVRG